MRTNAQRRVISPLSSLILVLVLFGAGIGIAAAADPIISITPTPKEVCVGDDFDVWIEVNPNGSTLQMAQVDLTYDSSLVTLTHENGGMFGTFIAGSESVAGVVTDITGVDSGVTTTGNLTVLHMHADAVGTFQLVLSGATAGTATETLTPSVNDGMITINAVPSEGAPIISVTPTPKEVCVGDDFDVWIEVNPNGSTLQMAQVDLAFDSSLVTLTHANGGMFGTFIAGSESVAGVVTDITGVDSGVTTTGNLTVLHMHADAVGTFQLVLSGATAGTATETLTPSVNLGTVTITEPATELHVVINEFIGQQWGGTGMDQIELYNPTDSEVNLTGWTIVAHDPESTTAILLLDGETITADGYLVYECVAEGPFTISQSGDILILKNGSVEVDRVAWGDYDDGDLLNNAPAPGLENSTGRSPNGVDTDVDSDDFIVFTTPTIGANNIVVGLLVTATPATIIVSEATDITISVADEITGAPIDGATVTLSAGPWSESNTTIGGECTFSVTPPMPGTINVDVTASGYNDGYTEVTAVEPPTLVTYIITDTVITPPQTTSIDVEFSERVSAIIKIEDASGNLVNELYTSSGVTDPDPKTWDGTDTDGETVPNGTYTVNVSGVNTTTGFSVVDTSKTITVGVPPVTVSIGSADNVSGTVDVSINITDASNIGAMDISVTYNASILTATGVANGTMTEGLSNFTHAYDISEGKLNISFATYPDTIDGDGELFVVTFVADAVGTSTLDITVTEAWTGDVPPQPVTPITVDGSVTVTDIRIGDMDGSGEVTFDDVILLARHIYFGDEVLDDPDVDSSGEVTFDDVILLARHIYFGDALYP
jgi:hypothetical protein